MEQHARCACKKKLYSFKKIAVRKVNIVSLGQEFSNEQKILSFCKTLIQTGDTLQVQSKDCVLLKPY